MDLKALVIHEDDNVANLIGPGKQGDRVTCRIEGKQETIEIELLDDLPSNHKFAFRDMTTDEPVIKYGLQIGVTSKAIKVGQHVHAHNIDSTRGRGDLGKTEAAAVAS